MLTTLEQIKLKLIQRWDRGVYLKADVASEGIFPLRFPIKRPSSAELSEQFEKIRLWINDLQKDCEKVGLQIEWKDINNRLLGRNKVPAHIVVEDIEQLAAWLKRKKDLILYREARLTLLDFFPELLTWAISYPFELIKHCDSLERLIYVTKWIIKNPKSGIYLRQISLPGVDTKFIEAHRFLLSSWLDILVASENIDQTYTGVSGFELRYGFLSRPETVRFRILDPKAFRNEAVGKLFPFSDMNVPASEFAIWNPPIKRIFIIENDITALAFPQVSDSIIIFGRGYNFNSLSKAEWMNNKELHYWGDIDTHGFAILNQFRQSFPGTESFLMDSETLFSHKAHWGHELKPHKAEILPNLNEAESALYAELKSDAITQNLRLEQELISFSMVEQFLSKFE